MLWYNMFMYKLIFLDTETTGNETKDYLCQVCYSLNGEFYVENFKPPVPISIESMAVHHITQKMVDDKAPFKGSDMYKNLESFFLDEKVVMIAHNAPFDIMMLEKEGLHVRKYICTLRLLRYLDDEQKIPRHNLQYLRYFLGFELDAPAHDAKGDVIVLKELFTHLLKIFKTKENISEDEEAIKKMIEVSSTPSLIRVFNFGKHAGKFVADVAKTDRGYLEWLLEQKKQSPTNEEDWIYTLEKYLKN